MPASFLTEILFRGVFEIAFYGLGYTIGWVVVPIFSLGFYSVEPWDFSSRKHSKNRSKQQRLPKRVSADVACGIGLVTLAIAVAIVYFLWRGAGA